MPRLTALAAPVDCLGLLQWLVLPGATAALECRLIFHHMRGLYSLKRSAVSYWERRRIIYNAALVLPALLGYGVTDTLNWVGDPHETHYSYIVTLFLVSAVGANICYSFVYVLEFVFWQR
jgi:hypothetical protein